MKRFIYFLFFFVISAQSMLGQGQVADLKAKFEGVLKKIEGGAIERRGMLNTQYVDGLKRLEGQLQQKGDLEALVEVKKERELFEKSGTVGNSERADVTELKEKLAEAKRPIEEKRVNEVQKMIDTYVKLLGPIQTQLTKSGDIEGALAAKAEIDRVGQMKTGAPAFEMPAESASVAAFEKVPDIKPPIASEDVFKLETWPTQVTIPQGNYRIDGKITSTKAPGQEIVIAPGSVFRGGSEDQWVIGSPKLVATKAEFNGFAFRGDLSARAYFSECTFSDTTIGKGGAWGGGGPMTRWQFVGCKIEGDFLPEWKAKAIGVQIANTHFERVEFPTLIYEAGHEPSTFALSEWGIIKDSTFRKCTIPASALSLMHNCSFESCKFVDDTANNLFSKKISRVIFVKDCQWNIKNLPNNLTVEQHPLAQKL